MALRDASASKNSPMLKSAKFHKLLSWVPILAAGGTYWVPISQKLGPYWVPISKLGGPYKFM